MPTKIPPRLESSLDAALAAGASDLFLVPNEPPIIRVAAEIQRLDQPKLTLKDTEEIARGAIGDQKLEEVGTKVAAHTTRQGLPEGVNARISVTRSHGGFSVTVQILFSRIQSVEELAFPEAILRAATCHSGLVVISGWVGSGMRRAAYSLVDYINSRSACHIATVENPIAVQFLPDKALLQQREVGVDLPSSLAGIQAAMRQDVDVLFVNDVAQLKEIEACIRVAEAGHLVIITWPADAPEDAVERIIDLFPENMREVKLKSFAKVLRGVSTQRLIPTVKGGRAPVYGVLIPDAEMRRSIVDGRSLFDRKTRLPVGCQSMAEDIERLEWEGVITEETANNALAEI